MANVNLVYKPLENSDTSIGVYVENVFDRVYYNTFARGFDRTAYLQPPRNVRVSVNSKF